MRRVKKMEAEMLKHARNLEFEEAAKLRDQITQLRKQSLGLATSKAG
jgi:excinuclease ABC subunit B